MTAGTGHRADISFRSRLAGARPRLPRLLGNLTYVLGGLDLLTGLLHSWRVRLHGLTEVLPGALTDAAAAGTVVSGILLLLLAHSLKRRKTRAWRAATFLVAVSVITHVVKTEPVGAAVSLGGLVLLVGYRKEFFAAGDPTTRWRAVGVFLGLGALSVATGLAAVALNARDIVGGWPGIGVATTHVLNGLVGATGPLTFTSDRRADIMFFLLAGLGLMTAMTTVYVALRPPERPAHLSDEDDERIRSLLDTHPDSLGYFNLRRDKSVIWSGSGKASICYRVVSGVMLASGDPIGDPEAWPGAIARFLDEAARHAWTPAVLGCSELGGTVWRREGGLSVLEIGDEAVVEVPEFTLAGRPMRNVRQMVSRIHRAGYTTRATPVAELSTEERERALRDAEAWRGSDTERGFSMALGRVADPADPDAFVVLAEHDGLLRGFLQFVPWGRDGLSLDLMRRDKASDPGVNELLVAEAVQAARELGVRRMSLNFAVFRGVLERGERLGAGPVVRAVHRVLILASRWFQIESLYRFNAKFRPTWQPRYLVYPSGRDLPRVTLAVLEAEAFLTWPRLRVLGAGS